MNRMTLAQRRAEIRKLEAEERWLLEALRKIKAHRFNLRVDRIQLEAIRTGKARDAEERARNDAYVARSLKTSTTLLMCLAANILPDPILPAGVSSKATGKHAAVFRKPKKPSVQPGAVCEPGEVTVDLLTGEITRKAPVMKYQEKDIDMLMTCNQEE